MGAFTHDPKKCYNRRVADMQLHTIMSSWKAIHSKDRLTHSLIRRNGKLEKASWDEAMDLVLQKSKEFFSRLTAHSIAFYTTRQLFLEEYYALALIGKVGLQTVHMYASCFRIFSPPARAETTDYTHS